MPKRTIRRRVHQQEFGLETKAKTAVTFTHRREYSSRQCGYQRASRGSEIHHDGRVVTVAEVLEHCELGGAGRE